MELCVGSNVPSPAARMSGRLGSWNLDGAEGWRSWSHRCVCCVGFYRVSELLLGIFEGKRRNGVSPAVLCFC